MTLRHGQYMTEFPSERTFEAGTSVSSPESADSISSLSAGRSSEREKVRDQQSGRGFHQSLSP